MVPDGALSHGPDRIGITEWIAPGVVVLLPCEKNTTRLNFARRFLSVPRLIALSISVVSAPWRHRLSRRRIATYSAMSGWMFSPHGSPAAAQTSFSAALPSGP